MIQKFKRIIVIVMDSVGIGQAHDCEKFGDYGVNTLGNISEKTDLKLPNMEQLGLGNINYLKTVKPSRKPSANYTKMQEVGDGKDTMTGHWEMMGCTLHQGFNQYVEKGFPKELIKIFEDYTKRKVLANKEASGMKVISEFYDEHVKTGNYIVYTSVDSTFQIAAHEEVIPLDELYDACKFIRKLTKDPKYNIARVIARPFLGTKKDFYRTANRRDYSLVPFEKTVMSKLEEKNYDVIAIGKISDVFDNVGVTKSIKTKSNLDGINKTITELQNPSIGLIFTNLVDFDSLYGHPRDVNGYKMALEQFDEKIPEILINLKEDDLLIITADHGNDPTYKGNDHTREYVPLLAYSKSLNGNNQLPICKSFEDLGQTITQNFNLVDTKEGSSFLEKLK